MFEMLYNIVLLYIKMYESDLNARLTQGKDHI